MIISFNTHTPQISEALYIAPSAEIIGNVILSKDCSIWPHTTLRGDISSITIGFGTNIQDNSVIHVDSNQPTRIGSYVTVGHSAIIHGCTIGDHCLIGMGSIILDGAEISPYSLVAAGALISPNKKFPPKSLIVGSPARVVRTLSDEELESIASNTLRYIELARIYQKEKS